MSRYYRAQKSRAPQAALEHIEAYKRLEKKVGPILSDINSIFFSLSPEDFELLLNDYSAKHGEKARKYAIDTYDDWMNGKRKMSGQTAERLLNLIPPRLPFAGKYELVKKICAHCATKNTHTMTINPDDFSSSVSQLKVILDKYSCGDSEKFLPQDIIENLRWLSSDDMTVARAMLAHFDKETHEATAAIAVREFKIISRAVREKNISNATHKISLPLATVTVHIERPKKGLFGTIIGKIFGA